jgi:hypothetical protein
MLPSLQRRSPISQPETAPRVPREAVLAAKGPHKFSVLGAVAVWLGALLLTWPALLNRYPLLYPDSVTYVADGRPVARALFLHQFSDYYGVRSLIYSLGILPFHGYVTLWPIVALNALLAAFVLWLVLRCTVPRHTVASYLVLLLLLSFLSSLSSFVSLIMPDILGPLLYLCIYLLMFARDSLARVERWALILIAWWAAASHATHLILATGLCVLLATLLLLRRQSRHRWKPVAEVAVILLFTAGSQFALHTYLYGEPSFNGERPPYLTARIIADGPGRWYLQQHCPDAKFALCDDVHNLPTDSDEFIWGANGVWARASEETRARLRNEELPFVLATLRAYPRQQIQKSAKNFCHQLTAFDFEPDANEWMVKELPEVLPRENSRFQQSRQAQDDLDFDFFSCAQYWTVIASLMLIGLFALRLWRRRLSRLLGLGTVIFSVVMANAFVTGALSTVEDRYQSRVVWLIPLLAIVLLLDWSSQWKRLR